MKTVTIINKFGPVSNAITGQNAKEMADYLANEGIAVRFVSLKADYLSAGKGGTAATSFPVKELKPVYSGRSPALRFIASLVDGFRLWMASLRGKSDVVIVMTDPPLLFMWFQLFRRFSKRALYYWTMDLYPEAFVAGNYIRPQNIIYKIFHSIVYRKPPDFTIALGNQQYTYLVSRFRKDFPYIVVPCGVIEETKPLTDIKEDSEKIRFGYGGNIGEAHDADFLVSLARQLDQEKHQLIVSLYGSKSEQVKRVIIQQKNVQYRDFFNHDDIASFDVNIATLLPEWDHICVPSKAVTAICCGTPLLLNASRQADNWKMFQEATWLVEAGTDYDGEIPITLRGITRETIAQKKLVAKRLAHEIVEEKNASYQELARIIKAS